MYGVPVLLSGLGSLVISVKEEEMIQQHHKDIVASNQSLLPRTPIAVIYFILPKTALLRPQLFHKAFEVKWDVFRSVSFFCDYIEF